jgi:hypothetical protein
MKQVSILALVAIIIISCDNDPDSVMKVTFTVKGLKKGTLYLQRIQDSSLIVVDSLQVQGDGRFMFETPLESPEIFYLYLKKKDNNEINDRITFFGEPGIISIDTEWNAFDTKAKVSGSETHKKLEEYQQVMSRINSRNLAIIQAIYDPEIQKDSISMDSIEKLSDKNILRGYLYALNFALNNADSYIAPYIALSEVADANIRYLDSIYTSLSPEVAASKYGEELGAYLEKKKSANP